MCDTPNTVEEAVANAKKLYDSYQQRKKAMETAEAKWKAAQKLIEAEHKDDAKDEGYKIATDEFIITASKARENVAIKDTKAVATALEFEEFGLSEKLMTFSITDLRKHLSPKQIEKLTEKSYGARTFKVKEV